MGESAMQSTRPTASQVRVKSIPGIGGMHEGIPTDLRQRVSETPIRGIRGIQSGLRSSTTRTFFQMTAVIHMRLWMEKGIAQTQRDKPPLMIECVRNLKRWMPLLRT